MHWPVQYFSGRQAEAKSILKIPMPGMSAISSNFDRVSGAMKLRGWHDIYLVLIRSIPNVAIMLNLNG